MTRRSRFRVGALGLLAAVIVFAGGCAWTELDEVIEDAIRPILVDERVAAAIAAELWTFDGEPYADWEVEGGCSWEEGLCDADSTTAWVYVTGWSPHSPVPSREPGSRGDVYIWQIDLGAFALSDVEGSRGFLSGYPVEIDSELDRIARTALPALLEDLTFDGAAWVEPPDHGDFVATYRNSETFERRLVRIDLEEGAVVEVVRES
jgi:hypothetical protein